MQQAILDGVFPPIEQYAPATSEHLRQIVTKALQVVPQERFSNARAMAAQLRATPEALDQDAWA